jgi:hypothetical protein
MPSPKGARLLEPDHPRILELPLSRRVRFALRGAYTNQRQAFAGAGPFPFRSAPGHPVKSE